ncbi:hypothetical protein FQK02_02805 [Xanthomonas vasicola]|uniref:hypothetical protein n=1 Tax=Xanthomonas vasicola TaxID=56459 RepID=UPI000F8E5E54|nr:hypothetical protein [Xanthomonas vasicola]MDO6952651.1 hypothetical protein [Xanthomonas vasicola]RRJ41133.1 hypothetical protein EIM46_09190 [Xanthomonas vasicola pv. musacearum]TWQ07904.1 hypothetical protein FQK02_02805 [Xanthomonas vasicola]
MSAILPPPAALENRSTKNKTGCGMRSWIALIPRTFARCYCFIGNGTGRGLRQTAFAAAERHAHRSAVTPEAVISAQLAGPMANLAIGDIAAANRLDANNQ